MSDWKWDAYAFGYSPRHNCNVGIRTNNSYWKGRYASLPEELKRVFPDVTTVSWGYGECRSRVDIWSEV